MNNPSLPNLDLLHDEAHLLIFHDEDFYAKLCTSTREQQIDFVGTHLDVYVFPQVWDNTHTGFDIMPDGSPAPGHCEMWRAYTTVFHEANISDIYLVFFNNYPCYMVKNVTADFIADLRDHNLAPYSKAMLRYNAQEIYPQRHEISQG